MKSEISEKFKFCKVRKFHQNLNFSKFPRKCKICRIPEIHFANFVDLKKSETISMSIWTIWMLKSALIQPRKSPEKLKSRDSAPPGQTGPAASSGQLPARASYVRQEARTP